MTATPSRRTRVFYRPETYHPDESTGYLMKRILNSLASEVDRELEPLGLTHAQWVPLYKLHMGQGATAAELATSCTTDAGAMTRTLDRLEAKGLVRRARSAEDRRVVNLELTSEGLSAVEHIPVALCKVLNTYLKGFSTEEWQTLHALLGRMLDNALELQSQREKETNEI
jgi:DNA-binding MarR family transcriptional regulator